MSDICHLCLNDVKDIMSLKHELVEPDLYCAVVAMVRWDGTFAATVATETATLQASMMFKALSMILSLAVVKGMVSLLKHELGEPDHLCVLVAMVRWDGTFLATISRVWNILSQMWLVFFVSMSCWKTWRATTWTACALTTLLSHWCKPFPWQRISAIPGIAPPATDSWHLPTNTPALATRSGMASMPWSSPSLVTCSKSATLPLRCLISSKAWANEAWPRSMLIC